MDTNNDNGKKDFDFVQEKIKPKNRKRLKKFLLIMATSFAAAIVFGVVARITFVLCGEPVNKLLGIQSDTKVQPAQNEENQRNQVVLPSGKDSEDKGKNSGNEGAAPTGNKDNDRKPSSSADSGQQSAAAGNDTITPSCEVTKEPTENTPTKEPTKAPVNTPTDAPSKPGEEQNTEPALTPDAEVSDNTPGPDVTSTEVHPENADTDTGNSESSDGTEGTEDNSGDGGENDKQPQGLSALENYAKIMSEMRDLAKNCTDSLVRVYSITSGINWLDESIETKAEQTGVLVADNGIEVLVMTGYHGIAAADRIELEFANGEIIDGSIYSSDFDLDIAIVAVEISKLPEGMQDGFHYMVFGDSDKLYEGEPVIAIGRPNGYFGAVQFGFISNTGLNTYITDGKLTRFATDFENAEESDGVIINLSGELVGIIENGEASGIRTGIAVNSLNMLLLKLLNGVSINYFGIRAENIPDDILTGLGLEHGIYVNEVLQGSPAAIAEIKKGDIILSINGEEINDVGTFEELVQSIERGTMTEVELYRNSSRENPNIACHVRISQKP